MTKKWDELDSIFEDDSFEELTKSPEKKKEENTNPELDKFQEIINFVKENGREPQRTDDWTLERSLWARLCGFRDNTERANGVRKIDELGLLNKESEYSFKQALDNPVDDNIDFDSILDDNSLLGDFDDLLDVSRYRKTINAADKIGRRTPAKSFSEYKPLFDHIYADISSGRRKIIPFKKYDLNEGRFYVQNGVMMYIVSIGNFYTDKSGERNAKMHVVYENGTENTSLLFRSLASSLYATERHGRMVTEPVDEEEMNRLFRQEHTTGYIYVLKSLSSDPEISRLNNLYKIGFTRGNIKERISNASNEITYLYAPVQIVMQAEVKNINAQILERTIHHVFLDKQVQFENQSFQKATEWYIVSLDEVERKINAIITDLLK